MTDEQAGVVSNPDFHWVGVRHGWASFELIGSDDARYRTTVSDGTDVFREHLAALRRALAEREPQRISFDTEPYEVRWTVTPNGGCADVRVTWHGEWGQGEGELRWHEPQVDLRLLATQAIASLEALRSTLGADGFAEAWPYAYPEDEIDALREISAR